MTAYPGSQRLQTSAVTVQENLLIQGNIDFREKKLLRPQVFIVAMTTALQKNIKLNLCHIAITLDAH